MFCLQFKSTTRDKKPRAENSVIRKHRGDVGTASAGGKQRQGSSGGQVRTGSNRTAAGVERQQQSNSGQCGAAAKIHRRTVSHRRYKTHTAQESSGGRSRKATGFKWRHGSNGGRIRAATGIERRPLDNDGRVGAGPGANCSRSRTAAWVERRQESEQRQRSNSRWAAEDERRQESDDGINQMAAEVDQRQESIGGRSRTSAGVERRQQSSSGRSGTKAEQESSGGQS
jgi:hypothetical protein